MAIKLGIDEHKFLAVTAGASVDNVASQRVLEKNGFLFVEKMERYLEVNGKWVDSLKYIKHLCFR